MPDIFISYAKVDKEHALKLAMDLKSRGLDVWWDAELYASQDYHNTILEALDNSKVAIVIWSPAAVKSKWVRDEAERAAEDRKLLPTFIPPFSKKNIPLGMGQTQSVDVNDRPAIYDALKKLGFSVPPQARPLQPTPAQPAPKALSDLIQELNRASAKSLPEPADRLEHFRKLVGQTEPFKGYVSRPGALLAPYVSLEWGSEAARAVVRRFLGDPALSYSAQLVDNTLSKGIRLYDKDVSEFALALSTLAHAVAGEDRKVLAALLVKLQSICNEFGVDRI